MRLVCPNCDAEYEVDASAIPLSGRDVQCSNCGHAWFQVHPEIDAAAELEADEAETRVAAEGDVPQASAPEPVPAPVPTPSVVAAAKPEEPDVAAPEPAVLPGPAVLPEPAAMPEAAVVPAPVAMPELAVVSGLVPESVPPAVPAAPSRSLDESVLAVLREEAERESAARRAEAAVPGVGAGRTPVIETQTELPLMQDQGGMAAAVKRIARLRGTEPEPVAPPPPPKSRREMLPAIEEINSTLRATRERTSDEETPIVETMGEAAANGGFRRGFLTLVLLAVVTVVLYLLAPVIAAKVPALAGVATSYVKAVDAARVWLDAELRSLIGALRGMAGGQGG